MEGTGPGAGGPRYAKYTLPAGGPAVRLLTVNDRADLLAAIKTNAIVRGDFLLSSGKKASWYVDLRKILLDGRLAPLAGRVMLGLTWDLAYDAVGGLTLGADPVATAMMHAAARRGTPIDAFVVRKDAKDHGTQRRIEGPDVAGRRVLAVEDTSTILLLLGEDSYAKTCASLNDVRANLDVCPRLAPISKNVRIGAFQIRPNRSMSCMYSMPYGSTSR